MKIEDFVNSQDFLEAVRKSTLAGFSGSGYSAEFFQDGSHRILWDNQIGNLYQADGNIASLPKLSESELDDVDENEGVTMEDVIEFYRDELVERFLKKNA